MFSIFSAISCPFFVSFINFILPFFSKTTSPSLSKLWRIFTAWLYVQSTSFAKMLPYLALATFFSATSIKAGFLLKNMSKLSFIFSLGSIYIIKPIYLNPYLAFKPFPNFVIFKSNKSKRSWHNSNVLLHRHNAKKLVCINSYNRTCDAFSSQFLI